MKIFFDIFSGAVIQAWDFKMSLVSPPQFESLDNTFNITKEEKNSLKLRL
jgi:hypothetical protein